MRPVLLRFAHGLGDVCQFVIVLKHLARHKPDWQITVRCGRGKHTALEGFCHRVSHDQEPEPDERQFPSVMELYWYENYNGFTDRPNTKVTNCLYEVFGLGWDRDLGSYAMNVNDGAKERAWSYLEGIGVKRLDQKRFRSIIIHYQGNTSEKKKNLQHWQAKDIAAAIVAAGRTPIILDWDNRSQLPDNKTIFCPRVGPNDIWGGFGSGDAATIAALVELSEAYIGIDSGPGKCASATTTPTLLNWIGHHPIQFHDLAANTTHLLPVNHRKMSPIEGKKELQEFFDKNYFYRTYDNEHDLVEQNVRWLEDVLHVERRLTPMTSIKYVVPSGIGDSIWAMMKIRSIAGAEKVDVILAGDPSREIDQRALPFLRRFDFVRSVEVLDLPILYDKDNHPNDAMGRYRYLSDGMHGQYHYLIPNATLEQGRRLEEWQPQHPVDWRVMDHFSWTDTDKGNATGEALEPFAAFYLGPESGHTDEGHNYGWLWEPKHWIELGQALKERGLHIAVIGASYDRSFWEKYVKDGVKESGQHWFDLIGKFEIGQTFALLKHAKVLISYQCGLAIVSHYLSVPVVTWWRPDGNSGHPKRKVCFDDAMKDSWTNPEYQHRYFGCLYQQQSVGDILAEIDQRGWLK